MRFVADVISNCSEVNNFVFEVKDVNILCFLGFLFFIGVVMGLLKKSRLVCAQFCLAVGGTLIYSTNSLRSIISGEFNRKH